MLGRSSEGGTLGLCFEHLTLEALAGDQLRWRVAFAQTEITLKRRLFTAPVFVQARPNERDDAFSAACRTSDPVTLLAIIWPLKLVRSRPLITLPPAVVVAPVVML